LHYCKSKWEFLQSDKKKFTKTLDTQIILVYNDGIKTKEVNRMTELQILRNSLFDEISRLKRGTADLNDTNAIVKCANAIISTYNTELKAVDLLSRTADTNVVELKIFNDDTEKNILDYKGVDNE
jgi:hypothetical protein